MKDSIESFVTKPIRVEVDSNGIPIDTINCSGGFYYTSYGVPGDVYQFKIIALPPGLATLCPASGIITDTIVSSIYCTPNRNVALTCDTALAYDLGVYSTGVRTGTHAHIGEIYAFNTYCPPKNATVTLNFSPRHHYSSAYPSPTSTTTTSITWNIAGLSTVSAGPTHLYYHLDGASMSIGDTVNSNIIIQPDSGDVDTTNNVIIIVDTARSGFDPNSMEVTPPGCIASGILPTELRYTIHFENTGNDTAFNIYVMDTLPDNVDITTLTIDMSSHPMFLSKLKDAAGHNILKFDFPDINLLDSSHHGVCDGAVFFSIKTKPGLANGTTIMNRAGIYFDINPVVMTNDAVITVGCPADPSRIASIVHNRDISIYPNPATDVLTIKTNVEVFRSLTITNSIGRVFISDIISNTQMLVNIKSLPAGLYYVILKGEQGNVVRKFVKM